MNSRARPLAGAEHHVEDVDAPSTARRRGVRPTPPSRDRASDSNARRQPRVGRRFRTVPMGDAVSWRAHVADARDAFFARVLTHLRDAASALRASEDTTEGADRADRRASRCLLAMSPRVRAAERHHPPPANAPAPHGASFAGSSVTLEVHPVAHRGARMGAVVVCTNLNATVRGVKRLVARKLSTERARTSGSSWAVAISARARNAGGVSGASGGRGRRPIRAQACRESSRRRRRRALEGVDADSDEAALARLPRCSSRDNRARTTCSWSWRRLAGRRPARSRARCFERCQRDSRCGNNSGISSREKTRRTRRRGFASYSRDRAERTVYALQALDGLLSPNDADEEGEANSRALLRGSAAASGCAREVLAVLPRGGAGSQGGSVEAASPASSAGASAWRDPESRRALCGASLSLLRISPTLLRTWDGRDDAGSLGIGAVAVSSPAADRGSDPDAALEDVVETTAASLRARRPRRRRRPRARRARAAVGSGAGASPGRDEDDNDAREANARAESVTREDVRLASAALRLLFRCVRSICEPPETAADILPRSPLFPSMVRDLMIQSPFPALQTRLRRRNYSRGDGARDEPNRTRVSLEPRSGPRLGRGCRVLAADGARPRPPLDARARRRRSPREMPRIFLDAVSSSRRDALAGR